MSDDLGKAFRALEDVASDKIDWNTVKDALVKSGASANVVSTAEAQFKKLAGVDGKVDKDSLISNVSSVLNPEKGAAKEAADVFEKEKNDPAMMAYLKSLGLDPNYVPPVGDERRVVVKSITFEFQDHENVVIDVPEYKASDKPYINLKKTVQIKEGASFKTTVQFKVQHSIVQGLKIKSTIKKMGSKVADDEAMLGSFAPKNDWSTISVGDWQDAPTGMLMRQTYTSNMKFIDDHKKIYMDLEYEVKISKDWK